MREVGVYDGDFPSFEQMLAGGSAADFPKEIWLQQVQPGEFAVRYKDWKTGTARNPTGQHVQSSEICRIFSSLEEARENSKHVTQEHCVVRCFIYDHTGRQVGTVSNNREVGRFAMVMYAGILFWLVVFAVLGMGFLWILSIIVLSLFPGAREPFASLGWLGWTGFTLAGLSVGILAWYVRIQLIARRHADRIQQKLRTTISPEERKRFEELNILHGSKDPAERERFSKLLAEYQHKLNEALKK